MPTCILAMHPSWPKGIYLPSFQLQISQVSLGWQSREENVAVPKNGVFFNLFQTTELGN